MTTEQIQSLQPGPESDRLVAEACGLKVSVFDKDEDSEYVVMDSQDNDLFGLAFSPSTDWNHAMFAAERFGLFRRWWQNPEPCWEGLRFLTQCDRWCVSEWTSETGIGYKVVAGAKSGPLAICRAILKLHHAH